MALGACCWAIIAAIALWDAARGAVLAMAGPAAFAVALRLMVLARR